MRSLGGGPTSGALGFGGSSSTSDHNPYAALGLDRNGRVMLSETSGDSEWVPPWDDTGPDALDENDEYCPPEGSDCEEADNACFEECSYLLGVDRLDQGIPYRVCWDGCMRSRGCR